MRELAAMSAIISFCLFGTGCQPAAVTVTVLKPAVFHDAAKLKIVGVLPFDGDGGAEFAARLEAALSGVNVADKQFFTVLERGKLAQLGDAELNLAQTGIVDAKTAAIIGRAVGAKGIFIGTVSVRKTESVSYKERRKGCGSYAVDKEGRATKACASWKEVACTKWSASFSVTPKYVEVESGKILYSKNIFKEARASTCLDSDKTFIGEEALKEEVQLRALEDIIKDIAPHYDSLNIALMDSTDGLHSSDDKKRLETGIEFAHAGRLDRACELWGEARTSLDSSVALLYNLGVCSEATGDLKAAQELYRKAERLIPKPVKDIIAALNRVKKQIKVADSLSEQITK